MFTFYSFQTLLKIFCFCFWVFYLYIFKYKFTRIYKNTFKITLNRKYNSKY